MRLPSVVLAHTIMRAMGPPKGTDCVSCVEVWEITPECLMMMTILDLAAVLTVIMTCLLLPSSSFTSSAAGKWQ